MLVSRGMSINSLPTVLTKAVAVLQSGESGATIKVCVKVLLPAVMVLRYKDGIRGRNLGLSVQSASLGRRSIRGLFTHSACHLICMSVSKRILNPGLN